MDRPEFDETPPGNEESNDVTRRDQIWLILAAVVPFVVATLWHLLF
jgi:hypothetical protein